MIKPIADDLRQIVALFHLTQPLTIPRKEDEWVVVEAIDLAEAASLSLALGFFLRQTSNRAARLQQPKNQNLRSI
jgi:hypothetical protein